MCALSLITLLAAFFLPIVAFAAIQPLIATPFYILGDCDNKEDVAITNHYE